MKILVTNNSHKSLVPLLPSDVKTLLENKHEIFFTKGIGNSIYINDHEYIKLGAKIVHKLNANFLKQMDVVLSYDLLNNKFYKTNNRNQVFWCHGFLVNHPKELLNLLQNKNTVISSEAINEDGLYPYSMAYEQVKGVYSVNLACNYLAKTDKNPKASGLSICPVSELKSKTTFLILNHSYAGYYAAKTALGLGANVIYLDSDVNTLKELKKNNEFKVLVETLNGSIKFDIASFDNLKQYAKQANVLIATNPVLTQKTRTRLTLEILNNIQPGGVYLDLGAESGLSSEASQQPNKENKHPDITNNLKQIVLDNIPLMFPLTMSQVFSNLNKKYLLELNNNTSMIDQIKKHPVLSKAVITNNGNLTNADLAKSLKLNYQKLK